MKTIELEEVTDELEVHVHTSEECERELRKWILQLKDVVTKAILALEDKEQA